MFGCQQVLIHVDKDTQAIIEYVCRESNKVFNSAVYYARQIYFKAHRYVSKAELDEQLKANKHFQAMHSKAAQQTCHSVFESFKSFKVLNKLFKLRKLGEKPRPPKYRKGGLNIVSYPKQALKLIDGNVRIPLGSKVKAWFGIDSFTIPMPSNLDFKNIRELRILPRNQCFYAEFVYKLNAVSTALNPDNALGIDPGMDNWLTCVSTVGTSFIVDGKHVKSLNRWYNKKVSTLKEGKPLCEPYGIRFVETEESYSSKASFVDGDYLPKYGEKPDNWKPDARRLANASLSGKRVKRGLYRTAVNWYINADCNGASNILRKVATMLGLNLSGVGRVSLTAPQRVFLWSAKRKKCSDVVLTVRQKLTAEARRETSA